MQVKIFLGRKKVQKIELPKRCSVTVYNYDYDAGDKDKNGNACHIVCWKNYDYDKNHSMIMEIDHEVEVCIKNKKIQKTKNPGGFKISLSD